MKKLNHIRETLNTWLGYVLSILMALMVLDVVWGVLARYLLNNPSSFTDELAGYLLIWVGLLGASLASGKGMHLAIDLLPQKLEGEKQQRLEIVIEILIFLFALSIMVVGGIRLMYITLKLGQTSPSLGIPLGYVYLVLPLSGIFIMFYSVANVFEKLNTKPQEVEID